MADKPDPFTDLLTHLVRVPKDKIDEQERLYQDAEREPVKPREIVPRQNERPEHHH